MSTGQKSMHKELNEGSNQNIVRTHRLRLGPTAGKPRTRRAGACCSHLTCTRHCCKLDIVAKAKRLGYSFQAEVATSKRKLLGLLSRHPPQCQRAPKLAGRSAQCSLHPMSRSPSPTLRRSSASGRSRCTEGTAQSRSSLSKVRSGCVSCTYMLDCESCSTKGQRW